MASSDKKWELIYWPGFAGRGEYVRLAFEEAGVPYEDLTAGPGKWTSEDVVKFFWKGGNKGYPVFSPPVIRNGDFQLAQTTAILQYLSKKYGMYPKTDEDEAHAAQITNSAADFLMEAQTAFHPKDPRADYNTQREEAAPFIASFRDVRFPRYFQLFESHLAANQTGSGWCVGSDLTYCDLAVFQVVGAVEAQFPDWWKANIASYPKVQALKQKVAERPNIAAYLKSGRRVPYSESSFM